MKKIKNKPATFVILLIVVIFLSIASVNASENTTQNIELDQTNNDYNDTILSNTDNSDIVSDSSSDLESRIKNANHGDEILIDPGTYKIHNIKITRSITLQGNGDARDIIIDGEEKSSIFLINSPDIEVTFKNITFINGLSHNFGGAISMKSCTVTVDNCIFINNSALNDTNGGGIANYGTDKNNKGHLLVNNSLFINNHADHDGGAIATHYAESRIYNSVFINNSAHRDGGAIRVSVYAYGDVQDCIFMFNHADEWGGAYYSWSGESNIERCIFMNNTGDTHGGALMVSGNFNLQDSIIVNNNGGEYGGSFYIQNPMYDTKTVINVHNNIITNNSSPYGKEIFIFWQYPHNLYTQFNDNDWGDEDPNDPNINDPDSVTPRSKVNSTIKSDLFNRLNINLLYKYSDLLKNFFPDNSLDDLKKQFPNTGFNNKNNDKNTNIDNNKGKNANINNINRENTNQIPSDKSDDRINTPKIDNSNTTTDNSNLDSNTNSQIAKMNSNNNNFVYGNSTSQGENEKAYELNESAGGSVAKQINSDIKYFIAVIVIVLALLAIGYKRNKRFE